MNEELQIKLKEYEENMNTYRYLAELNVKYFMFFIVVSSFSLNIYVNADEKIPPLLAFIFLIGGYVSYSIYLVYKRMTLLNVSINKTTSILDMNPQDFTPFLNFLRLTIGVIILSTILISFGMFNYHGTI